MFLTHAKIQIKVKLRGLCNTEILFKVTEMQYCLSMENKLYAFYLAGFCLGSSHYKWN